LVLPHHPASGELGYETWPPDAWRSSGAENSWAGMALDTERGIVFAPTGPAADYYGAKRLATTFSPTACLHWMPGRGNVCGTFRPSGTTCGIGTFLRRRHC